VRAGILVFFLAFLFIQAKLFFLFKTIVQDLSCLRFCAKWLLFSLVNPRSSMDFSSITWRTELFSHSRMCIFHQGSDSPMLESRKFLTSGDLISLKCSSASMRASLCFISQIHRKKLCFQIGGCIILDEPSLSNELSSFANGRIFGNVVIGIYSDHNSHEIDSHPRILVAAGKKAIAQKDKPTTLHQKLISHQIHTCKEPLFVTCKGRRISSTH
jgi:hypothetical protein